jgi:hypothetical protein
MTVGIDDENGLPLGYGVISNVSEAGGCVWTDSHFGPRRRLVLRISFAHPAEVHEVAARVVWTGEGVDSSGAPMRRYGLTWDDASSAVLRLRNLAREAIGGRRTGPQPAATPSPGLDVP